MNLTFAPGILEQVIAHAKDCYPREGCGLIVGRRSSPAAAGGPLPEAEAFVPMDNISTRDDEYEMDPKQLIRVLRNLRNAGKDLAAIYHSHPHGLAEPSKKDIERAFYPEAAYLIVSLNELERPRAAAFRITGGEVIEIELHAIV